MRRKSQDIQTVSVSVSLGATSGTALDICNPLRGTLKKVEVKAANDANVSGMKVQLLRGDSTVVYTGDNEAIVDDGSFHGADSDKNLDISLKTAAEGNYTWQITVDAAAAAAMTVYVRRIIEV